MADSGSIGGMTILGGEITSSSVGRKATAHDLVDGTSIDLTTAGEVEIKAAGTNAASGVQRLQSSKFAGFWIQGDLVASDAAAGVFSVQNTYGSNLAVTRVLVDVQTVSSGACTVDIGQGSGSGTSYDNLIDGLNVGAGVKLMDNLGDPGTNGNSVQKWLSSGYVNASMKTGNAAGLVGTYALYVVDIN